LTLFASGSAAAQEYNATPTNRRRGGKTGAVATGAVTGAVASIWEMVGGKDLVGEHPTWNISRWRGDISRAGAHWFSLIPGPGWIMDGAGMVDQHRLRASARNVESQRLDDLNVIIPSQKNLNTGNVYLDRVAQLKEMQKRHVSRVTPEDNAVWYIGGHENTGAILHEGPGKTTYDRFDEARTEPDMSVDEMIRLNLSLFYAKGGTIEQAKQLLNTRGLHQAVADTTQRAHAAQAAIHHPAPAHAPDATHRAQAQARTVIANTHTTMLGAVVHEPAGHPNGQPAAPRNAHDRDRLREAYTPV
jgi:hypothetical protein